MAQSNVIAFCLFFAFIVFITLRGELPRYLEVLTKTQASGLSGSSGSTADVGATAAQAAQDPIGAAAGALRRSLGIGNGLLSNFFGN